MTINTTDTAVQTATVKVSFDGYDYRNVITVTSPTGRTVRVRCNGRWNEMSAELADFVARFNTSADAPTWRHTVETTMSFALMRELLAMSAAWERS